MSTRELIEELRGVFPRGSQVGEEFSAPCPFHKGGRESRPSFSINLEKGVSFCHTCHEGWSAKTLLREMSVSSSQSEAILRLFPQGKRSRRGMFRKKDLFVGTELPEEVLAAYRTCPVDLLDDGFSMETLKRFEVGYDRLRGRIVYPIRNYLGTLIGLFGRVPDELIGEVGAKYKPYQKELQDAFPGYKLGEKQFLWNYHKVFPRAWGHDVDQVVVVEGFKQLMWVYQSGYKDVVALLGSYMTKQQEALLQRLGCDLVLLLDNDKAGRRGTIQVARALRGIQKIAVCVYPRGVHQPDDLTTEQVKDCINNATNIREWRRANGVRS